MTHGWSLVGMEWARLVELTAKTDWRRVKLGDLYRDSVPARLGTYAICTPVPGMSHGPFEKLYNAVYVGKGVLRDRFLQHCNNPGDELRRAKECFGDRLEFWFTQVRSPIMDELETRLYQCLGPSVNKVFPSRKILARIGEGRRA